MTSEGIDAAALASGGQVGAVAVAVPYAQIVGDWLSAYPWEAWCTLTFRAGQFSPEAATRAANRWLAWARREGSPEIAYFIGHECGGQTGRLHLHGLIGNLGSCVARKALWREWFTRYGRAQILPYDPTKGAAHYVSKYVSKGLDSWDFSMPTTAQHSDPNLSLPLTRQTSWTPIQKPHRPRPKSGTATSPPEKPPG